MRKMLNTLFINSEDAYLALENENVVVLRGEEKMGQYPLTILENIVSFSYKGASPALMGACAARDIHLCFLTPNGRFLARVCGQSRGNVLLRKEQYRVSDDSAQSCMVARNMIFGKIFNSRWVLERMLRDHAMRADLPSYQPVTAGYAAPQQGAMSGEPEVPAFVNEGAAGQRVSPYAAMPDMPMQSQQAPAQEQHEDRSTPRSFMDGIPAYMRRK